MPFPESFLNEITEKNDIVSVVSEYVNLSKRSGANLFGLCPFHNEKTPSFSVSQSKQIYHCFGCGKGGGVINFVMEIENLGYRDAVAKLADRAGIKMPEEEYDPDSKLRARLYAANKAAARWFHEQLLAPSGKAAQAYIEKRQLSKTVCTNFGLGFAPDSWSSLKTALNAEGFTDEELYSAGLLSKSQNRDNYYDKYRNRLMFPVIDVRGNVIAFSGRALGDFEPKYLNSPDSKIFSKGRNIFALNLAKSSKEDYFILVEGNVDVVSLHQAGFDSAVASLGTAFTDQQAQLLSRYKSQVILAYDNDTAGINATSKAMRILDKLDVRVRVIRMDGAKDPDEFIKAKGADAFRKLIEQSESRMEYLLQQLEAKYNLSVVDQKASFISDASKLIARLPDKAQRQVYSRHIADKVGVSAEAVITDVERVRKRLESSAKSKEQRNVLNDSVTVRKYSDPASASREEGIIRILFRDPSLISVPELPSPEQFSDEKLSKTYSALLNRLKSGEPISISSLSSELDSDCISLLVSLEDTPESLSSARETLLEYISGLDNVKRTGWENINAIIRAKQNEKKG